MFTQSIQSIYVGFVSPFMVSFVIVVLSTPLSPIIMTKTIYPILYSDDINLTESNLYLITMVINLFSSEFSLKD